MKKKTIFAISVDHSIDLITNSSSELFVLQGKSKEILEEVIKDLYAGYIQNQSEEIREKYPDHTSEYGNIKHISELTADELDNFFNYATGSYMWPAKKENYRIPNGFTFDEVYEPDGKEPAWNGHIQYKVKNNEPGNKWGNFVTEENKEWFLNKFDPNRTLYFLYSLDENPQWEFQEKLETIGTRYHLG